VEEKRITAEDDTEDALPDERKNGKHETPVSRREARGFVYFMNMYTVCSIV
jgi:hypothetical protein